jgi:hypothetical protein
MPSWLRVLGLRLALLCALLPTVLASRTAAAKPDLPFALVDSFDRAFALVYDAAERQVARLEAAKPPPPRHDIAAVLVGLDAIVTAACDAATANLDVELAVAASLSSERRHAVLGCIERHLDQARKAMRFATDPQVRAEYSITCERLRDVRRRI